MTQVLIVVEAQKEFSAAGKRAVPNQTSALAAIADHVDRARREARPIAWVRHHNRPDESPAFVPNSWGAEFSPGLGPQARFGPEQLFEKNVYGAFTGTSLKTLASIRSRRRGAPRAFYANMCLSTCAREAVIRGFDVSVDPDAHATSKTRRLDLRQQTKCVARRCCT
jgi:nicotinamidase-related amidase